MAILLVNASGQYLSVPNESDYDLTTGISITGWFKHNGLWIETWEAIVTKGDYTWRLSRYSAGAGRGLHWDTDGVTGAQLNWNGTFDDDAWHFVGVTFQSGAPGLKQIFLDGAIVASDATVTGTITNGGSLVYLGENADAAGRQFNGLMEDVRIYNRGLAIAELSAIWAQRGADGIKNGLVSRWVGDQGAPGVTISGTVQDAGVEKNNATPINSPTWDECYVGSRRRRAA